MLAANGAGDEALEIVGDVGGGDFHLLFAFWTVVVLHDGWVGFLLRKVSGGEWVSSAMVKGCICSD